MAKINYYLILEKRLGDYNLIDINKLDICDGPVSNDISSIDSFTLRFNESEIIDSIRRSNMSQADYLGGTLKVVSDVKHNLPIVSKDMYEAITRFQNSDDVIEQDLRNKMFSNYEKIIKNIFRDTDFIHGMLDRFKAALKNNNKKEIFQIIEELPYPKIRIIYLNIYNYLFKNKSKNINNTKEYDNKIINLDVYRSEKGENLRVLEKLNDVA